MANLRIATWNLERPKPNSNSKNPQRLKKILEINADLCVFTETHSAIALDHYYSLASTAVPDYHSDGESYATIWSRWPIIGRLPTYDPFFTVCAVIDTPIGPAIVFGTIITYANDRGPNNDSRRWEEHRKSINAHGEDWLRLRNTFPNHMFCVAGDFNQSRDGSGWYEDADSVTMLTSALQRTTMRCVTEQNMRANGLLQSRASVDHICLSHPHAKHVVTVAHGRAQLQMGIR